MAPMLFTRAILAGEPITVFNHGQMQRDFTYIDDIVAGVVATLDRPPVADPAFDRMNPSAAASWAPYKVFHIGNSSPVPLMDFIALLEHNLGRQASLNMQPMAPGDVAATYADVSALTRWTGLSPTTPLAQGIQAFTQWYREYFTA